jgi:hypothetical protein
MKHAYLLQPLEQCGSARMLMVLVLALVVAGTAA